MLITDDTLKINVKSSLLSNEETVKLLEITRDNKLVFEPHLNEVSRRVGQKKI